ncbi:hypothetical protein GCM10028803_19300 [Larkinella knui]|uniref:DUF1080 domain-containing protein n=1 Tax=Larkinella knui TaxID=2025310 RepID=A0A3P1CUN5_9BACT|nr:DUF1080 domain-containing protein [Larkinella knui]RRB17025.1 DUF1080 domain-containing protein [Larkinella knui]
MHGLLILGLFARFFFGFSNDPHPAQSDWIWLFDGTNTSQWISAKSTDFPKEGWSIENKTLVANKGGDKSKRGGDLVSRQKFRNFDLRFEFKLTPGANSGLKYFVKKYPDGAWLGCEYQIIDDQGNKDIAGDKDDKRRTAGLYELFAPSARKLKPIGQWNEGRIVVNGKHVEHWLNGVKVVEYERGDERFNAAKAQSKFKSVEDFGVMDEGFLLLQDHGDESAFRQIRIRELPPTP